MIVPCRLFTKDCNEKKFTANASDIKGHCSDFTRITLCSDFDHTADFELTAIRYDKDGDVMYWCLEPIAQSLSAIPKLSGWSVTIFND
jgi:hypothetical protein